MNRSVSETVEALRRQAEAWSISNDQDSNKVDSAASGTNKEEDEHEEGLLARGAAAPGTITEYVFEGVKPLRRLNTSKSYKEKNFLETVAGLSSSSSSSALLRRALASYGTDSLQGDNAGGAALHSIRPAANTPRSAANMPLSTSATALPPSLDSNSLLTEAMDALLRSRVSFRGMYIGTIAALDPSTDSLNYNQVFVRDFFPSGLAFLMIKQPEIVKNFLIRTLLLQGSTKQIDNYTLGEGVMPASFKVRHNIERNTSTISPDFGGSAIGRVAPVDSGFWWIILLRAYTKSIRDHTLANMPDFQHGIRLILSLCLSEGFDTLPTLLCADGCCMIDRRMGIYGYPVDIQALFFMALRCAKDLLLPEGAGKDFLKRIDKRLHALTYHMRQYYWLDFKKLNNIYRYKTEEYSHTAVNKFNVIPESIPDWVFDFMPVKGGYFIGNVSPARMDFRWFCVGNCVAVLSSLATQEQETAIMDLFEERWQDLVGEMPLKIIYPALENHEWRIVTGYDPKNTRWSYHNGGSWPVLLWLFTAACLKAGRKQMARRAVELAEQRLSKDHWPEYYDGKLGSYVGKQARKWQTWSIAGYFAAKSLLEDPSHLGIIALEDKKMKNNFFRSASF